MRCLDSVDPTAIQIRCFDQVNPKQLQISLCVRFFDIRQFLAHDEIRSKKAWTNQQYGEAVIGQTCHNRTKPLIARSDASVYEDAQLSRSLVRPNLLEQFFQEVWSFVIGVALRNKNPGTLAQFIAGTLQFGCFNALRRDVWCSGGSVPL